MIALSAAVYADPRGGFVFSCEKAEFPDGTVTLLTGENGSGKTTLCRLLCGVLRPDKGYLLIDGEDATAWPLGRIGAHVGYLLQEPSRQLFRPSVFEELTFVPELLGRDPQETAAKAEALLAEFGLTRLKDRSTLTLSRGEKQRLALAALLMGGAGFFILDEPTTGLDTDNRRILYDKIEELREKGAGFAIASHDRDLLALSPRRLRVTEGRVVRED